jgi:DNA-binding GntR family transcriptional regulator
MKSSPTSKPRSDQAFASLRSRILEGYLEPGALLAESAVAQDLGVSRVPVREALFTLEREGLVEFSGTGRAYVKELSPKDFEELHVLRLILEPVAARLAAPTIRRDASALLKNIAATRKARALGEVTRLDLEFHELILEMSGNERLLKLWRSIRGEFEMWLGRLQRQHRGQKLDTREQTAASHEKLVEAFRSQSPATCERLTREHIIAWREWLPVLPENE